MSLVELGDPIEGKVVSDSRAQLALYQPSHSTAEETKLRKSSKSRLGTIYSLLFLLVLSMPSGSMAAV